MARFQRIERETPRQGPRNGTASFRCIQGCHARLLAGAAQSRIGNHGYLFDKPLQRTVRSAPCRQTAQLFEGSPIMNLDDKVNELEENVAKLGYRVASLRRVVFWLTVLVLVSILGILSVPEARSSLFSLGFIVVLVAATLAFMQLATWMFRALDRAAQGSRNSDESPDSQVPKV